MEKINFMILAIEQITSLGTPIYRFKEKLRTLTEQVEENTIEFEQYSQICKLIVIIRLDE